MSAFESFKELEEHFARGVVSTVMIWTGSYHGPHVSMKITSTIRIVKKLVVPIALIMVATVQGAASPTPPLRTIVLSGDMIPP